MVLIVIIIYDDKLIKKITFIMPSFALMTSSYFHQMTKTHNELLSRVCNNYSATWNHQSCWLKENGNIKVLEADFLGKVPR